MSIFYNTTFTRLSILPCEEEDDVGDINYLAVVAAAVSTFIIGGIWWSPLMFQKAWMQVNGFRSEDLEKGNMAKIFGLSFLFSLIMAFNLAMFLADPGTDLKWGATA